MFLYSPSQNCNFPALHDLLILQEKIVRCLTFFCRGQRSGSTTKHYNTQLVCFIHLLNVERNLHFPYIVLCHREFLLLLCISCPPTYQHQLCSLLQLSGWNTSFMHQPLEKRSLLYKLLSNCFTLWGFWSQDQKCWWFNRCYSLGSVNKLKLILWENSTWDLVWCGT